MRIVVPYTKITPITHIALRGIPHNIVKVSGKYGYSRMFRELWKKQEDFINIEHDCIVWPGATQKLIDCSEIWCAYDYSSVSNWSLEQSQGILHSIPLGCMKITKEFISKTVNTWDNNIDWHRCDVHLFDCAVKAGIKVHQHYPGIVNGNKELFKLCKEDIII